MESGRDQAEGHASRRSLTEENNSPAFQATSKTTTAAVAIPARPPDMTVGGATVMGADEDEMGRVSDDEDENVKEAMAVAEHDEDKVGGASADEDEVGGVSDDEDVIVKKAMTIAEHDKDKVGGASADEDEVGGVSSEDEEVVATAQHDEDTVGGATSDLDEDEMGAASADEDEAVKEVVAITEHDTGTVGGASADEDEVGGASAGNENGVPAGGAVNLMDFRPVPPSSLDLSGSRPRQRQKKVLVAPALSLSLGRDSSFSGDFLSPEGDDDTCLDIDLDAMDTPSDSESLPFPIYDLDDDLRRLGVASRPRRHRADSSRCEPALESEDILDSQGTRWRCFSTGEPPQESRVNMSVLEPFVSVLSHGGYYGDGMNDIIVFSSCFLPQNSLERYTYVMDHLFRYVVGTLDLMVAENYVIVYFCAGGQREKLPEFSWLRECYTTINHRLRKNLKGFYVVHPTWYIKALITIIKPFISSKFSRKLTFVDSLQELSAFVPTEQLHIPECVRLYDDSLSR